MVQIKSSHGLRRWPNQCGSNRVNLERRERNARRLFVDSHAYENKIQSQPLTFSIWNVIVKSLVVIAPQCDISLGS